jgi:hypothetical protein
MAFIPLALPSHDVADYLKRYGIAAIMVLAPAAETPCQFAIGIDVAKTVAEARRAWPKHRSSLLLAGARWAGSIASATKIRDMVLSCDLRRARKDGNSFHIPVTEALAAVDSAARRLDIRLTPYAPRSNELVGRSGSWTRRSRRCRTPAISNRSIRNMPGAGAWRWLSDSPFSATARRAPGCELFWRRARRHGRSPRARSRRCSWKVRRQRRPAFERRCAGRRGDLLAKSASRGAWGMNRRAATNRLARWRAKDLNEANGLFDQARTMGQRRQAKTRRAGTDPLGAPELAWCAWFGRTAGDAYHCGGDRRRRARSPSRPPQCGLAARDRALS